MEKRNFTNQFRAEWRKNGGNVEKFRFCGMNGMSAMWKCRKPHIFVTSRQGGHRAMPPPPKYATVKNRTSSWYSRLFVRRNRFNCNRSAANAHLPWLWSWAPLGQTDRQTDRQTNPRCPHDVWPHSTFKSVSPTLFKIYN